MGELPIACVVEGCYEVFCVKCANREGCSACEELDVCRKHWRAFGGFIKCPNCAENLCASCWRYTNPEFEARKRNPPVCEGCLIIEEIHGIGEDVRAFERASKRVRSASH